MATKTVTFTNWRGFYKTLNSIPKAAQVELRVASQRIADRMVPDARRRAVSVGGVARYVAPTIRSRKDRIPTVVMGGAGRLPARDGVARTGGRQTVGDVIWGAEFGGGRRPTTRQFDPWLGNSTGAGYFLWPVIRAHADESIEEYGEALLTAIDKSARGAK